MDYQLDLTAYRCPLPLLMTKKALKTLPKQDKLQVLISEQTSRTDFELLANQLGYLLNVYRQEGLIVLYFEKQAV